MKTNLKSIPAVGICGFSGSGKTTLIEAILPILRSRVLKIAVVKQDTHGLSIDHEGKDSDRLYKAGADIFIRDQEQCFSRQHRIEEHSFENIMRTLVKNYDLILVEGHKSTPMQKKIWLCGEKNESPPPEASNIYRCLKPDENRIEITLKIIDSLLDECMYSSPLYAGILIGGKSRRMGSPKHLLKFGKKTWLEHLASVINKYFEQVVLLGSGKLPPEMEDFVRLHDAPNLHGPIAGILSAMRWQPMASWIFLPCDMPFFNKEALTWLIEQRKPGVWAIMPRTKDLDKAQPLPAYCDFRFANIIENASCPKECANHPKVSQPHVPENLLQSWHNINNKIELKNVLKQEKINQPQKKGKLCSLQ